MTTRFWLIRHGETEEWALRRCCGWLDVGLSANGRLQIAQASQVLKSESINVVFSSPLRRALEGGRSIAAECSCSCEVIPEFREINFGDFEGLGYDEIAARHPAEYERWMGDPVNMTFPNGENLSSLRTRVLDAFQRIANQRAGDTVAIVTHGGVIRVLIAWALKIPDDCIFRIGQNFGALNLVTLSERTPSVLLLNGSVGSVAPT